MRRMRHLLWALAPLLFVACDQGDSPAAPELADYPLASAIVDGSTPGGLEGFFFRPPIADAPRQGAEPFDGSLLDLLSVEVCEWTGSSCVTPPVARITSDSPHPERLRIVRNAEYYRALWNTGGDDLDPAKTYRVRVLASGGVLGYADVDLLEPGEAPGDDDVVPVEVGDGLPVSFRIEEGLGQRVDPDGAVVSLADGSVTLQVPEGALDGDVFITASPATDLPPDGPQTVPGTAWDFGPDGLEFDRPVTMTIAYDPALLPPETDESELRIHELVDGEFVQADAGLVDLQNHTVSALVDGFSVFVILQRLFPGSREDLEGPAPGTVEVFDPSTGAFGSAVTLDLSSGDVVLRHRLALTDNISGVQTVRIDYESPTGGQARLACIAGGDPTSGSDTNGSWECEGVWPRYGEPGEWIPRLLQLRDRVGNIVGYFQTPAGFCDNFGPDATCFAGMPRITVVSSPSDTEPPDLSALEVSLDVAPRMYGSSVSVDAGSMARPLVFRFAATDDLAGVGRSQFDFFRLRLRGPSAQFTETFTCNLVAGTELDGIWECPLTIPQHAEAGTWTVDFFLLPDRAANGSGRFFLDPFRPDGTGQICRPNGDCVPAPVVEVTSDGDAEAPFLEALSLSVVDATVTVTMDVTDDLSGAITVNPRFNSATTTQFHQCFASLVTGTRTDGTFECSFTFPEFSATGDWFLSLRLVDAAGNQRFYSRRASDGFLCYFDPVAGQVCEDFGDTDIVVR